MFFPDEFIAVAEETGLIHMLGKWLIESTCAQLALWLARYGEQNCPYISINVSPIQLAQDEVVDQIAKSLMAI
ncbi:MULTISPECIES: EAL domain-containing protein [Colwellia]|uniref:EAL domain-containing protein n=1 Tax=Colwellia TaxID=28228 RepID=UPI0009EC3DCF|nr:MULTISPECIES: EAL domain-containing protein [Colwellia]